MRSRGGGGGGSNRTREEDYRTPTKSQAGSLSLICDPSKSPDTPWEESPYAKLKNDDTSMALLLESSSDEDDEHNNRKGAVIGRTNAGRATRQRRRRKGPNPKAAPKRKSSKSFIRRFYLKKIQSFIKGSNLSALLLAASLWYSLGVVSISTSKWLLMKTKLPPIVLTLQQLLLGSSFLRFLLSIRCLQSPGVQPLASLCKSADSKTASSNSAMGGSSLRNRKRLAQYNDVSSFETLVLLMKHAHTRYLCLAGLCFSLGFYCTNLGFNSASAAFVETIKASEPITSAILAVIWGLEVLTNVEVSSLVAIVCGVVLSTLGNAPGSHESVGASFLSCIVVMASNLCFSFRGLYQKLFQSKSSHSLLMDDLNLQYRMQQMGVIVFAIPCVLWEGPSIIDHIYHVSTTVGLLRSGVMMRYIFLSLLNAIAFASYNLASTYLLSRISVVHHAALNCIRRIFAIVVTSMVFGNPLTLVGVLGILVSFGGFMTFTYAKAQKSQRPKPITSLLPLAEQSTTLLYGDQMA